MAKGAAGPKVYLSAAFAPANLVLLAGSWVLAGFLGVFVWGLLGMVAGLGGSALYARSVLALARDPNFAYKALAASDLGASSLKGSQKLELLREFGRLPEGMISQVRLLEDLGKEVEERLEKGAGTVYDKMLRQLVPETRRTLEEAVGLASEGAQRIADGADPAPYEERLAKITDILRSMQSDLRMMEGDQAEALPGDRVVHQLEDLSGEVKVLRESLEELEG